MRKKYEIVDMQGLLGEGYAYLPRSAPESDYMPFKWSRRLITCAAIGGSVVFTYAIYEFATNEITPIIQQEIGPPPPTSTPIPEQQP
jgi:hypothetical protein